MTTLPRPDEPSMETLRSHGKPYEGGIKEYLQQDKPLKDEVVWKRAVIDYLWDQWKQYEITYQEVASACGDADIAIELWIDDEYEWSTVLDQIEDSLNAEIE